jgi:hypothetical protein
MVHCPCVETRGKVVLPKDDLPEIMMHCGAIGIIIGLFFSNKVTATDSLDTLWDNKPEYTAGTAEHASEQELRQLQLHAFSCLDCPAATKVLDLDQPYDAPDAAFLDTKYSKFQYGMRDRLATLQAWKFLDIPAA